MEFETALHLCLPPPHPCCRIPHMPPRLQGSQLAPRLELGSFAAGSQCRPHRRPFSSTAVARARKLSRARRAMFNWLEGPGSNFLKPRKGSTNYLSAYDASGKLIRAEESGNTEKTATNVPSETVEDLHPFPLNRVFRSEPVLSTELRDEIYNRIAEKGQTVREVSVDLSVTMERVAAVYRMKEVEKRWAANVSLAPGCLQSRIP